VSQKSRRPYLHSKCLEILATLIDAVNDMDATLPLAMETLNLGAVSSKIAD